MIFSNLKKAMDARGIQPLSLRKQTGIDYSAMLRHYKGLREISAKDAIKYEELLGISRSELRPDLWPPEIWNITVSMWQRFANQQKVQNGAQ